MSRLQVGGLALTLNSSISEKNIGLAVVISKFIGDAYNDGFDRWEVVHPELLCRSGEVAGFGYFKTKDLLPLGDKQTQDELAKEKELEYSI